MNVAVLPRDAFRHITTWVFDLDNTLYAPKLNLFAQIDQRITLWIANHLGVDGITARFYQKYLMHRYGTTMNGLMAEGQIDQADFLDFAHAINYSAIKLDEKLRDAVKNLKGRKYILTNGTRRHAQDVAQNLGIFDLFDDVFDIAAAGYHPKPKLEAYERFLKQFSINPADAALFEDMARNLEEPHKLGMRTVLVKADTFEGDTREPWEFEYGEKAHVDFMTDDLASFLASLL